MGFTGFSVVYDVSAYLFPILVYVIGLWDAFIDNRKEKTGWIIKKQVTTMICSMVV